MKKRINSNPYTSAKFQSTWLKHFKKGKPTYNLGAFKGITFIKGNWLSTYLNVGKTFTNGISYDFENKLFPTNSKSTFLIYDIPQYFELKKEKVMKPIGFKSIKQYHGYLVDLSNIKSIDAFLLENFSSKSRWQINKSVKRLNTCFTIRSQVLFREVDPENFELVFKNFRELLLKRYNQKKSKLHWLTDKNWNYLKEVFQVMLQDGKAIIYVLYANDEIIGINTNFLSKDIMFSFLPVFNIDYTKFNVGQYMMKLILDWCIKNQIRIYDFSKGEFEYKKRWSNYSYRFEYHIFYRIDLLKSKFGTQVLVSYYSFKQFCREKGVFPYLNKVLFKLQVSTKNNNPKAHYNFQNFEKNEHFWPYEDFPISTEEVYTLNIRKPIFDFIYKNSVHIDNVSVYKQKNNPNVFLIKTKNLTQTLFLKHC